MKEKSLIQELFSILLWVFVIVFVMVNFVGSGYFVPSRSMETTLMQGDFIWVNKAAYGGRFPQGILSVFFPKDKVPYLRLPGYTHVKRNDVVAFNFPLDFHVPSDSNYVKRCIGLPGDTLQIIDKEVFINKKPIDDLPGYLHAYVVNSTIDTLDDYAFNKLHITESETDTVRRRFIFTMTKAQADSLRKSPYVTSVGYAISGSSKRNFFPAGKRFPYTKDNYGPIVIPQKGVTVHLNTDSIALYENIISHYEHHELQVKGDSIYIDGKYATHYTFSMNYYFMLGDNRDISDDSRYWGFVPEDHIIGKVSWVEFSIRPRPVTEAWWKRLNGRRWFKSIQ